LSGIKSHWLNKKDQWKQNHAIMIKFLLLGCGLILLWSIQFFSFITLLFIAHLGIISILYVLPIRYKNKFYSLRNIPLAKIFFLSYVWASLTVIVPFLDNDLLSNIKVIQLFIERFLFVFAITIPFDVRDLLRDKKESLKTLPISFGICRSLQLSRVFLISFVVISFVTDGISYVSLTRVICATIAFVMLDKINLKNKDNFYLIGLDGLLILYFVLLVSLKYIFA
jgi:4-hydroxybenzoate polyprenyltransferase